MWKNKISIQKKDILFISLLILAYLLSRLINILYVPIFTDEAIYLRWSQIALHDASWRFISLTDGKQPLFIWLTLISMKFISDPLLAGRLVSVLAGLGSMCGLILLGKNVFNNKNVGYISAIIYIISPFFIWYDKLALMDSLLACFYIWGIYLEIHLYKNLRLDCALILGMVIGGGILTKTSAFFLVYLLPIYLLYYLKYKKWNSMFKFIFLSLISVIISSLMYGVLRLSPWFYMIAQKDLTFIYSINEILSNPFVHFWGNFGGLSGWWITYLTLPFIFVLFVSLFWKEKKYIIDKFFLFIFFLLPFLALSLFGKVLYPRFILFMTIPLIPIIAHGLFLFKSKIKNKYFLLFLILIFAYPVYFAGLSIINPINAPLPNSDRRQFLDDWPSGYGVSQVVSYLKNEKSKQPIFVATEGTFGLFPYALELVFYSDPSINIKGYWPLPTFDKVIRDSEGRPAFLILKESQSPPSFWNVTLLNKYKRGKGDTFLMFYKINN